MKLLSLRSILTQSRLSNLASLQGFQAQASVETIEANKVALRGEVPSLATLGSTIAPPAASEPQIQPTVSVGGTEAACLHRDHVQPCILCEEAPAEQLWSSYELCGDPVRARTRVRVCWRKRRLHRSNGLRDSIPSLLLPG